MQGAPKAFKKLHCGSSGIYSSQTFPASVYLIAKVSPESYPDLMNQRRGLLSISAIALLLLVAAAQNASVLDSNVILTSQTAEPRRVSGIEYINRIAGFSFTYPEHLILEADKVSPGSTGQEFSGVLTSSDLQISFGGASRDYSYPRGGSVLDTHGYSEKDGAHLHYVWGDYAVQPSEFIPVNGGTSRALLITNMNIEQILGPSSTAAFINLPSPRFPGVVFVLSPLQGGTLSEAAVDIFRSIVSSVRFVEPQDVQGEPQH